MRRSAFFKTVIAVGAAAVVTSGCLSSASSGGGDAGASGGSDNKVVSVWSSLDQPTIDGLKAAVAPKAQAAGITLNWTRVDNINQLIITKIQANDLPDIVIVPQPGVVKDIVTRGKAIGLDDVLDMGAVKQSMIPGTLEAGQVDGKQYGLLVSMNVKSVVFYPKKAWDAAGFQAPKSIDELNTLTETIKGKTKTAPWCMGIGSEAATGWPATDWFEDLTMRYGGVQGYNDWVAHKTKFDSPLIKQSAAEFEKLMFTEGNVLGGRKAIASTSFGTAGNPMFENPPKCWMYKQGTFITGPDFLGKVAKNPDAEIGVFGFPPATAGGENPVLGGGDLAVLLNAKQSAKDAIKLMSAADLGKEVAKSGSYLSPHKDFDSSLYPTELTKKYAEIANSASAFLFDGSDAMPAAVGTGSFWKEITSWVADQQSLDDTLKKIDESWPAS
jgi:alpha-glucoside transport system substrate-binding protein